jgi:hypothetical protein
MTRERLADGLEILCLQLANGETSLPPGWAPEEWATLKGIALNAIWTIRTRFLTVGQA